MIVWLLETDTAWAVVKADTLPEAIAKWCEEENICVADIITATRFEVIE